MKYRKKPVEIEAAMFDGKLVGNPLPNGTVIKGTCPAWFPAVVREVTDKRRAIDELREGEVVSCGDSLLIGTLEGVHEAKTGDWIIQGIKGEIYPCKPDIFTSTYDPA
ncbi:hypothetical protein [Ruegeria sp. EL01]|jgi:hypothetical protein|uniref:hypothetical protein n=1 Tax=Ruegeria sp. EL01 TaxID=2107578 RepID=UPI000EA82F67|nr:hypothetical protein [Ruegeria sp. EL01]